jgi:hypothetical protein
MILLALASGEGADQEMKIAEGQMKIAEGQAWLTGMAQGMAQKHGSEAGSKVYFNSRSPRPLSSRPSCICMNEVWRISNMSAAISPETELKPQSILFSRAWFDRGPRRTHGRF